MVSMARPFGGLTAWCRSYPDHIAERGPTMVDCDAEERGYARAEFDAAFSASYQWTVRTNVKSQLSILDSIHTV